MRQQKTVTARVITYRANMAVLVNGQPQVREVELETNPEKRGFTMPKNLIKENEKFLAFYDVAEKVTSYSLPIAVFVEHAKKVKGSANDETGTEKKGVK